MHATDAPSQRAEILRQSQHFPFFKLIGLEILDLAPGRSSTQITWRPDLQQPAGLLHGGVIASLIDTGTAYALLLCDELQNTNSSAQPEHYSNLLPYGCSSKHEELSK